MGLLQQFGFAPQQLVVGGIKKLFGGMGGPEEDKNSPSETPLLGQLQGLLGTAQGSFADPTPVQAPFEPTLAGEAPPTTDIAQLMPMVHAVFPAISRLITSDYGPRKAPKKGASSFHKGIDIGGKMGDPIMSALSGVITAIGRDKGYGNFLRMLADNGDELLYGHAGGFKVKPGQRINAGDILGQIGNTGISTGPHLHFEAARKGKPINPHTYGI